MRYKQKLPEIIVILGPTASGKTSLGIELAKRKNGVIISADSRQVYAEMNIGTAKPKEAWRAVTHSHLKPDLVDNIEHYMFNICNIETQLSLSEWQKKTFEVISRTLENGKTPILVGGTMLYIDSIIYNYSIPNIPQDTVFRSSLEKESVSDLYNKLLKQDPEAKSFIEPKNKRRIIRALEVMNATGESFSKQRKQQAPRYSYKLLGIFPGWNKLETNIELRIPRMMSLGLIDEVASLQKKYGNDCPLLQTMYYKEIGMLLKKELNEKEALQKIAQVSKRYAHRQMSWWKRNKDINWSTNQESALSIFG